MNFLGLDNSEIQLLNLLSRKGIRKLNDFLIELHNDLFDPFESANVTFKVSQEIANFIKDYHVKWRKLKNKKEEVIYSLDGLNWFKIEITN